MNFDKNYGNHRTFSKQMVKQMVKPIRSNYGKSVNYRSEYTNARGNYGFRFREHMDDVNEDNTEVVDDNVDTETTMEQDVNFEPVSESIEIPPELQIPETNKQKTYQDEPNEETGDFFDYLKQSSESTVDKMKRFLGFGK